MPLSPACATPSSVVDTFGRVLGQQLCCRPCRRVFRASGCNSGLEGLTAVDNGAPGRVKFGHPGTDFGQGQRLSTCCFSHCTADHMASSTDAPQTSFDVLCQTLVYLGPAIRWEQDHSLSESVSWELPPGHHYALHTNFCFEVMHPDAMPIGCQARLCGRFLPALSCCQQPTSQAAQW